MSADWRWTDEDSRDLDERNRQMRKPRRYVPPISTKEADTLISRKVTTLDQFHSRPGRRKSNRADDPEVQRREWERTKQQLRAAGVRVVERSSTPSTSTERRCEDCGVDISHRGASSTRCVRDAARRKEVLKRERKSRENQQ
jgi:hypothetical protein